MAAYWILTANSGRYRIFDALREGYAIRSWRIAQLWDEIEPGDEFALWVSGPERRGVYALGVVTEPPKHGRMDPDPYWENPAEGNSLMWQVGIRINQNLIDDPILVDELVTDSHFADALVLRMPGGKNPFRLTDAQWRAIVSRSRPEVSEGRSPGDFFMEITRRDDIGADLNAPLAARGGVATASYGLVPSVRPSDVVVHYDSRHEAIVGVSVATGPAEPTPVFWVSRGSYARRAGERPRWLPGIRVPLSNFRELRTPLTLAQIRGQKDALLAIRSRIQAAASGQPIYFPWIPYRDTLRTFQSYLVKMPYEAISLFPQLRAAVDRAKIESSRLEATSPVQQAEEAINSAAGKLAGSVRGQGFQLDQEVKVAVEVCAMNAATEFYAATWEVEDVHGKQSYDLVCRRGDEVMHVEVKGTTADGKEVLLTPNEVKHAREYPHTSLFILSNVRVMRSEDGIVTATDGVSHTYDPWTVDKGTLTPIGFRYQVPGLACSPGQDHSNY